MEIIKRVLGFHKTPPVLVEACLFELEYVVHDVVPPKGRRLNKRFFQMKNFLFGKGNSDPTVEECEELAKEIIAHRVILRVMIAFSKLTQIEKSSFVQVFAALLSRNHYHFASTYMISQEGDDILQCIIRDLSYTDLSAHCALLLQECIKCRYIHNHLFESYSILKPLFTKYAYSSHFDTCSDVLQIIYTLLRINKQTIINSVNPDNPLCSDLFEWMRRLISCDNYVTVRMSLSILAELLMDPLNMSILQLFMEDIRNIRIIMNLLCSPYNSIQLHAFNIFKLYVAYPHRSAVVNRILSTNRDKLLSLFVNFLPQHNDETFIREKKIVISIITSIGS